MIELKYADISEIAGVLAANSNVASNDTFSPQQTNIGTSSLSGSFGGVSGGGFTSPSSPQSFGGGAFGQATGLAQRVNDNIAVDRRLNAVILTGTPDVVAGLREVISKLDVAPASVILETQIVELSDTAARNIGLDFQPDGSGVIANASGGAGSTTTGGGGYTVKSLSTAQGSVYFQGNLYAAVTEGNARIIAKPRILAQSGQQASILTGDALPILTSVVIAGSSSTISNQVSYVNVGVNLQILPRVSSDGFVSSHIYAEVSSVTGYTQTYPQISQRTASTLATVRDGQSFVIGGLLQDNEIKSLTKLPFVGDLPLIGAFFRHVNNTHTQDNLYIIVTPHIVGRSGIVPPLGSLTAAVAASSDRATVVDVDPGRRSKCRCKRRNPSRRLTDVSRFSIARRVGAYSAVLLLGAACAPSVSTTRIARPGRRVLRLESGTQHGHRERPIVDGRQASRRAPDRRRRAQRGPCR